MIPLPKPARLKNSLAWRLGILGAGCLSIAAQGHPPGVDFFESKIRPVLVERCYSCHSAQSEQLRGGLRLDTREGWMKGGEGGRVIIPGDAESSRLIRAIRYQDPELQMPPKKPLTPPQLEDFAAWINMGAPDPRTNVVSTPSPPPGDILEHWAFQRPSRPSLPAVKKVRWAKTPIDLFILAKLEANNLSPSAPADKRTLLRRASYDLLGLPPSLSETDEFMADSTEEAFARMVDRWLASPHYGERWSRHWLDIARYADTKGYVYGDREEPRFVHSHVYRDWVIRALNEDMPYDRFLRKQIAAEEGEDLAAHGFLTLGRRFLGVIHDIIDDRIDVLMRGTQALTVACARCHDHKYDPIPTRDYYALYGVFASSTERLVALESVLDESPRAEEFRKGLQERTNKYAEKLAQKSQEFSNRFRDKAADYLEAVLEARNLPAEEHYEILGPDDLNRTVVRHWEAYLAAEKRAPGRVWAPWQALRKLNAAEFQKRAATILAEFGQRPGTPVNPLVLEALREPALDSMREVARRYGRLLAEAHRRWQDGLAETGAQEAPLRGRLPEEDWEELRQVLYGAESPVRIPEVAAGDLEWYFDEKTRVELMKLHAEIERWIIQAPGASRYALILEDRPDPKNARVFLRGNPATKGEEAPRQFLSLFSDLAPTPFQSGSGRRELAEAIASPDNPLTARVMVNRVWQHHFGAGLVRTPSDFGTRSEPPSHPELLDWLASYFVAEGWSLKKLHRLIMLSSVYQQRSDELPRVVAGRGEVPEPGQSDAARAAQLDPENRLLWRMDRHRLDLEALRDSMLVVSGELDWAAGGRPDRLFGKEASRRRTVYGLIDRQFLPNVYRAFDFANPDLHSPQRPETTVPQQALFFMNNSFVAERARELGQLFCRAEEEEGIRKLYQAVLRRLPTENELGAAARFFQGALHEPAYQPPSPPPAVWHYGYGRLDESKPGISQFALLPHFTGKAWQGGEEWPDKRLGWLQLTAAGGHAGNDLNHAVIRRWIAPADAAISISGVVEHGHEPGDGVRAWIFANEATLLGHWTVHHAKAETVIEQWKVQKGDTIDFVVDFRGNLNSDEFKWAPLIQTRAVEDREAVAGSAGLWDAKKEFGGPPPQPPRPLDPWARFAQVLLLSNEFMFVD